jgi:uncharacterized Zn finger protein (UPF0148 family)
VIDRLARCDRCNRPLIRSHDELECLVHGTRYTPERAGDRVLDDRPPESKRGQAPNAGRPWSARDRRWVIENKDRLSSREMARRLRRTEHAINQVLSKAAKRKARVRNSDTVRKQLRTLDALEDSVQPGRLHRLAGRLGLTYRAAYLRLWRRGVRVRDADGMVSVSDVVRDFGYSRRRVLNLIASGELPAVRLGRGRVTRVRLDLADVEALASQLSARSKHDPRKVRRRAGRSDTSSPHLSRAQDPDAFLPGGKRP